MTRELRRYLPLALGAVALFMLAALAGYFTEGDGSRRPAVSTADEVASAQRGGVQSLNGDELLLLTESGHKPFKLGSDTTIEIARPVPVNTLAAGDWLNVGAQRNDQSMFTIVGLTLIPQSQVRSP